MERRVGSRVIVEGLVSRPELNGRKGRIVTFEDTGARCGVDVDGMSEPMSLKKQNVRALLTDDKWAEIMRHLAPKSLTMLLDDLIAGTSRDWHNHAEDLTLWVSPADAAAALAGDRLEALMQALRTATLQLGMNTKKFLDVRCKAATRVLSCQACNTCYDAGTCSHEGMAPKLPLPRTGNVGSALHEMTHHATQCMAVVINLLTFPDVTGKERLVDLLVPEMPAGVKTEVFLEKEMLASRTPAVHTLIGLVDNCSAPLPKCAHLAMSLLGLLIARRPVQVLGLLDPEPTTKILHNYLMPIFDRIKIAPCIVEERFGTVELLNAIPVLFHLADWTEAVVHLPTSSLPQSIATLCINLLHLISDDDAEHSADCPADLELFCELRGAIVHAATLYGNGAHLMRQRPSTFAMACLS